MNELIFAPCVSISHHYKYTKNNKNYYFCLLYLLYILLDVCFTYSRSLQLFVTFSLVVVIFVVVVAAVLVVSCHSRVYYPFVWDKNFFFYFYTYFHDNLCIHCLLCMQCTDEVCMCDSIFLI